MSPYLLQEMAIKARSEHQTHISMRMRGPKTIRTHPSDKVRTPFGLCEWSGVVYPGREIVIYVSVEQVDSYIDKILKQNRGVKTWVD